MGSLVTVTLAQHDTVRQGLAQLCLDRTAFLMVGRGCSYRWLHTLMLVCSICQSSSFEKSSMCRKCLPTFGGRTPFPVYVLVFCWTAAVAMTKLHLQKEQGCPNVRLKGFLESLPVRPHRKSVRLC